MGRKNNFPLLLFGIVLVTALIAILVINYLLGGPNITLPTTTITGRGDLAIPSDAYSAYAPPTDPLLGGTTPYATAVQFTNSSGTYVNVAVRTEPGVLSQYVYTALKLSQSNSWKEFTFISAPLPGTAWISGNANVTLGPFVGNNTEYVAVFVCRKYTAEGNYICGPKSIASNAKNWTLISFTIAAPSCTDDPTQFCLTPVVLTRTNTTNGTGACQSGKLCYKCAASAENKSGGCFAPVTPTYTCANKAGQFCTPLAISDPKYNLTANSSGTCQAGSCASCTSPTTNQSGGCFAACTDGCSPGDSTCSGQQIRFCGMQANGCYNWNAPQACSDPGRICESGAFGTGCFPPTCGPLGGFCNTTVVTGAQAVSGGTCLNPATCYTCGSKTNCNGACVDLQTDRSNCGACGRAVGATEICVNGNPICGGCNINSVCYANGQQNPGNECLVCNASQATSSWWPKPTGTACVGGVCDPTGACKPPYTITIESLEGVSNNMQVNFKICNRGTGSVTLPSGNLFYAQQVGGGNIYSGAYIENGAFTPLTLAAGACSPVLSFYDGNINWMGAWKATTAINITVDPTHQVLGTSPSARFPQSSTTCFGCGAPAVCQNNASASGMQYSLGSNIYRCMALANAGLKWIDMTTDSCVHASFTTPTSLSCGACAGNPVSVQSMIGTTPYSLSTPQGSVYYARCCPSSSYCTDAENCFANGVTHPQFPTFRCQNGAWTTA